MTYKKKKYLLDLARKKGYQEESEQIDFLKKYFFGNFDYYEEKICNQVNDKDKKYWRLKEQERISEVISILKAESQSKTRERINTSTLISASEIANFQFCPVSFSIQRTYEVESDVKMEMGSFIHDTVNMKNGDFSRNGKTLLMNKIKELPKLYKNRINYSGHLNGSKTFVNTELNISCKPDYIISDNNSGEKFIIEEKYSAKALQTAMYLNQKIQLIAYLLTIPDVEYGYVITWRYYSGERNELKLILANDDKNIDDFLISKNDKELENQLKSLLMEMRRLISEGEMKKKIKYSSAKCSKCSVSQHCRHKKTKEQKLAFPYA